MVDLTETRSEKETRLWKEWKQTGSQQALSELLTSITPIIERSVRQWSGSNVSTPVLRAKATNLAVEALGDWDPNIAQMNTHLINRLQKLSRLVYEHQNVARIPESRTAKIGAFKSAQIELEDKLGRDPSVGEMSDYLSWNPKEITKLNKEIRKEVPESFISMPAVFSEDSDEKMLIDYYYSNLNPKNQLVFEHLTGYGNKPVLSEKQIGRKLGFTEADVFQKKKTFVDQLKEWKVLL